MMEALGLRWLRWRALVMLALGRPAAALALFDRLLARCPADRHAQASRAHLLAASGRLAEAETAYMQLLGDAPLDAASWFNLGWVREQRGDDAGAIAAFTRATEVDARLDRAWFGLGQALWRQRQLEGAAHALAIVASEGEREVEVAVDPGPLRWRSQARQPLRVVGVTALVTVGVVTWLLTYGVGCL